MTDKVSAVTKIGRVTSNKPQITQISRHHFRRSSNNSWRQPMKRKTPTKNVIHVTIGLPRNNHRPLSSTSTSLPNSQRQYIENKPSKTQSLVECPKSRLDSVTITKIPRRHHSFSQINHDTSKNIGLRRITSDRGQFNGITTIKTRLSRSSKVVPHESIIQQTANTNSDERGVIDNSHRDLKRNKKKRCSRRCIIAFVICTLILAMIITAILLILLIKPTAKTTTTTIIPQLRWNTTGITIAGVSGTLGVTSDKLSKPWDIEWDVPNTLYIADTENDRVQKYLIGDQNGLTIAGQMNGTAGSNASQLRYPRRILLHSTNGIYISDSNNQRIQYWTIGDTSGITAAGTGVTGTTNNTFSNPYGLAYNSDTDTLYISDYYNNRVMAYQSSASSGTVTAGGNGYGTNSTQLGNPVGLYFDAFSNSLIIANYMTHSIVRWTLGANSWTLLAGDKNGNLSNNATQLNLPASVTFDPMGNMYVADRGNHRIQLFMSGQFEGLTIAGVTSIFSSNSTFLYNPCSVKLDNQLNLYVADTFNHRVQKFLRY